LLMMESQLNNTKRQERYAYMFRFGQRRFLFVRNFGAGVESVAQLVQDVETGENLIRKVTATRPTQVFPFIKPFRPKKPNEVVMLDKIVEESSTESKHTPYICNLHAHEYIKSQATDPSGFPKYHSISYWKLCNGRSVRARWLVEGILPPTMVVARMVADVLGTLQYLYTAGKQPVYHHDVHLGNVWMSWSADQVLPSFYLGDFADAAFADAPYYSEEKIARPVNDLHKFWRNLEHVVSEIGERRGLGNPGARALRRLADAMCNVVVERRHAENSDPPPNLTSLIEHASELEEMFGEGGIVDETQTPAYIKYVTEERERAFKVDREKPRVVRSIEEALHPAEMVGSQSVPIAVHGPWYLVKATADGKDWVRVEPKGVTHHRPNRTHVDEEDLSRTIKLPDFVPFVEPDSSDEIRPPSNASYSSGADSQAEDGDTTLVATNPDVSSKEPSPAPSWTVGDDAHLVGAIPEPSPAFSFREGDDDKFKIRELSNLFYPTAEDEGWQLCLDQSATRAITVHNHSNQELENKSPSTTYTKLTEEALEDKLAHWHGLVHHPDCECPEMVWTGDVENILAGDRARRSTGGFEDGQLTLPDSEFREQPERQPEWI